MKWQNNVNALLPGGEKIMGNASLLLWLDSGTSVTSYTDQPSKKNLQ